MIGIHKSVNTFQLNFKYSLVFGCCGSTFILFECISILAHRDIETWRHGIAASPRRKKADIYKPPFAKMWCNISKKWLCFVSSYGGWSNSVSHMISSLYILFKRRALYLSRNWDKSRDFKVGKRNFKTRTKKGFLRKCFNYFSATLLGARPKSQNIHF